MKSVTLIASRTVDHIHNLDQGVRIVRQGGPAFYCEQAMVAMGLRVHLLTTRRPTDVYISVRRKNERIRIEEIGQIRIGRKVPTGNVVLSPILGEFDLKKLVPGKCRIFLDAQGYIRSVGENITQEWDCDLQNLSDVVALKVNERERGHVSKRIMRFFKSRILIITRGQNGVEIWEKNRKYVIKGNRIKTPDTLGAGDTFFGSFVASYLQLADVRSAAKVAIVEAEEFLQRKRDANA